MVDPGMRARGLRATAMLVAGHAAVSATLWWGTAGALAAVRAPGTAQVGTLLAVLAAGTAWVLLTWLTAGTLLAIVTTVGAGVGSRARGRAAAVTPAAARRLAAALLGVSVLGVSLAAASPAGAGQAVVAGTQHGTPSSPAARAAAATVPDLDRPAAGLSAGGSARLLAELPGGWTPDRPAASSRRTATEESSVRLVTSAPHAGRAVPDGVVVVRRGDTLWGIAARHLGPRASAAEVAEEWPRWYAANRAAIGDDPDLLAPGERLRPP